MRNIVIISSLCFISYPTVGSDNESINVMGRVTPVQTENIFSSGIYASRDTFGMRANAVIAAFRANAIDKFGFPVLGLNSLTDMAKYRGRDSVALYADNTSTPFSDWEIIKEANYTPTAFSAKNIDEIKIKPGMLIETMHVPKWSSFVVSVNKEKVITAGWVNNQTGKLGTPENGVGLRLNPVSKIWAVNFNAFLQQNSRSNYLVVQENGVVNNKIKNPTVINGIDTVILPQSLFGGTAAYLARSADYGNHQQWIYGFMSQGAKDANFTSYDRDSSNYNTNASFKDESSAQYGLLFMGRNKLASVAWKKNNVIVSYISNDGLINKIGYKTKIISSNTILQDNIGRYIIDSTNDITLTLPQNASLIDGYTLKLTKIAGGNINIITSDKTKINKKEHFLISDKEWNKEAIYINNQWFIE